MATVVWLPEALDDIERLHSFLLKKNPVAARNAVVCIKAAANQLTEFPDFGRGMDDDSGRRQIFAAFGAGAYVLRYRIDARGYVVVIRVWHSREMRE